MHMADISKFAGSLAGQNVRPPLCDKHEPKTELVREGGVDLVHIHCTRCKFSAYMAPSTYDDLMNEPEE